MAEMSADPKTCGWVSPPDKPGRLEPAPGKWSEILWMLVIGALFVASGLIWLIERGGWLR
jgi:hypothetical protein